MKCSSCKEEWWALSPGKTARFCPYCGYDTESMPVVETPVRAAVDEAPDNGYDGDCESDDAPPTPPYGCPGPEQTQKPPEEPPTPPAEQFYDAGKPGGKVFTNEEASLLTGADVSIPHGYTCIGPNAFWEFGSKIRHVAIPKSVTSIGKGAFGHCQNLATVTIPNSVTAIRDEAFVFCKSLTDIMIPNSVTDIGNYAFSYCENLKNVTIPDSVKAIGKRVFSMCGNLKNVVLPDGLTTIGHQAFYGCESLKSITVPGSVTKIDREAFKKCGGDRIIIRCHRNSYAHNYALANGLQYEFVHG
jgi:DNA-directed RNA polymerase subunit RPC12/RpoP